MIKINDSLMEKEQKKQKSDFIATSFFLIFLFVLTLALFFNNYIFSSIYVSGQSMSPTLQSGNVLYIDSNRDVEQGDIIVIDKEKQNFKGGYDWLIKRVIAKGEKDKIVTVEIIDGYIFIDGQLLREDYLPLGTKTQPIPFSNDQPPKTKWELREGEIFYLGDNRGDSSDSRFYAYDLCKEEQVIGIVPKWALSTRWLSGSFYNMGEFFRGIITGDLFAKQCTWAKL